MNGLGVIRILVEILFPDTGMVWRSQTYLPNLLLGDLVGVAGRAGLDRGAGERDGEGVDRTALGLRLADGEGAERVG
jgi:hypothetical protein